MRLINRKRTMHWLWDGPGRHLPDGLTTVVARLLCRRYGHEPTCDQCHRPEHDFCVWCNKLMPGQAHRGTL
jgi:hypothetical protein